MTGQELRHIRESKGLTRDEFAKEIGNCTASGIVKWEKGNPPVPQWVADKLLSSVTLKLPLDELAALLNHATSKGQSFEDMLTQALRDYLKSHDTKILPIAALAEEAAPFNVTKRKASGG